MPWFKVDDNLAFHAKTMQAGNSAMGLWVRAGSWSAHQLTDGFIPDHIATTLGTRAQAKKLVAAHLWETVPGGFRFHEWTDRQPSRSEVEAERHANRERMRRARAARKGTTKSEQNSKKSASSQVSEPRADAQSCSCGRCAENVRPVCGQPDPVPVPVPIPVPSKSEIREDVETLCKRLAARVEANGSKKVTIGKQWRDAARLMLDKDGRTYDQIAYLIDWSQNDEFWRANILSMPKLREKFDQLRLKATTPTRKNNDIDWDAAMERARAADERTGA